MLQSGIPIQTRRSLVQVVLSDWKRPRGRLVVLDFVLEDQLRGNFLLGVDISFALVDGTALAFDLAGKGDRLLGVVEPMVIPHLLRLVSFSFRTAPVDAVSGLGVNVASDLGLDVGLIDIGPLVGDGLSLYWVNVVRALLPGHRAAGGHCSHGNRGEHAGLHGG